MICTIYSHYLGFEKITETIQKIYPKGKLTTRSQDGSDIAELEIKGGLFGSSKKIRVSYRQRNKPSHQFPEIDDSPLTKNLKGLYGFVSSLPASNQNVKDLFLHKIQTLNSEFSLMEEQGETKEFIALIQSLAHEFDAIVFAQPNTIISKSTGQHFLDRNLKLIIDGEGNCDIDHLDVKIEAANFDADQASLAEDQVQRKENSEKILRTLNIKINTNLPCIESESETTIRDPKEIAQRVTVLAMTNLVAFNEVPTKHAKEYLQKFNLWDYVTPKERAFLANPTDDNKRHETWKCECIWTLMWALKKIDDLGAPNVLCDLQNIPPDRYPVGASKDPNTFINTITEIRSKKEIIDAADLYYRIDWACVDARINGREMNGAHPSVVYERHYALNWLVNYMEQPWDDVSCDT